MSEDLNSHMVNGIQHIAKVNGYADWEPNGDSLRLNFYVLHRQGVSRIEGMVKHYSYHLEGPHSLITQAHLQGALQQIPTLLQQEPGCHDNGYIVKSQLAEVISNGPLPWALLDDPQTRLRVYTKSALLHYYRGFYNYPRYLHEWVVTTLRPLVNEWVKTDPIVEVYLNTLAEHCASFWVDKLYEKQATRRRHKHINGDDISRFRDAIKHDCLSKLHKGILPNKYFVDSSSSELHQVLIDNDLGYLYDELPWKAEYHFDLSKAPQYPLI